MGTDTAVPREQPESHRTTVTLPAPTHARARAALEYERARGILPQAMTLPQYLVALVERQLLGQVEGWADAPPWRKQALRGPKKRR